MSPRNPIAPGLGKGLGSLIPLRGSASAKASDEQVRELPVNVIIANPLQPRQVVEQGLDELVSSIREHGILQPLVVQPRDGKYELIAGERRFRAARRLGLSRVPVVVRTVTKQQQLELALVENLQRKNLNPLEEAVAYQRLIDEFNLTQEQVGQKVGKSRSYIANVLRLRSLPEPIQASLARGEISEGHAKVLLGLSTADEQVRLWKEIVRRQLPVRGLEVVVRAKHGSGPRTDHGLDDIIEKLQRRFGTRAAVTRRHGRGKIILEYFSLEEFRSLVERLLTGK